MASIHWRDERACSANSAQSGHRPRAIGNPLAMPPPRRRARTLTSSKTKAEETAMPLLQNHIAVVTGAGFRHRPRDRARICPRRRADGAARHQRKGRGRSRAGNSRGRRQATSFALDVASHEDCIAVAKKVADKVGRVSILVNNAGINRRNAITADADAVLKDWQDIMAINLNGIFNVTHAFLAPLRASQGPHRQYRLDPVLCACAHAEFAGLYRLQARRARLHQGARRRTRQGRRARQRDRPGLDRDAAQRRTCAPPIRSW